MPLFKNKSRCLGVDVGASSVKVVELAKQNNTFKLANYGLTTVEEIAGTQISTDTSQSFSSSAQPIGKTVKAILQEAGIKTSKTHFAVPDFSSFFTSFEIPKMQQEEVESAIQFQARQRIPLPLNEVTLDPNLIDESTSATEEIYEVVLLAVPNDTVKTYRRIAQEAGLEVGALEAEAFGLALTFGEEDKTILIADIGNESTTVNIVTGTTPRHSHSFDISGKDFKEEVGDLPEIGYNDNSQAQRVTKRRISLAEDFSERIDGLRESYEFENDTKVDKIVITGGGSKVKEIQGVLAKKDIPVERKNPFDKLEYPSVLDNAINELGALFSVAIGMALLGLKEE